MKRFLILFFLLFSALSIFTKNLDSKGIDSTDDQFYPELQGDKDMMSIQTKKTLLKSGIQYGVWIIPVFIHKDTPTSNLTTSVLTSRIWAKTYLWENSFLYARGKYIFSGIIDQTGISSEKNSHVADLDVGFIAISNKRQNFKLFIGRKYYMLGSGLVLNGRGDGAEFRFYSPYIDIKIFGSYTGFLMKDDNPFGLSDKDISDGARRLFSGGKISTDFLNQTLYLYGMAQFDFGNEYFNNNKRLISYFSNFETGFRYYNQKSRYHSQYYGIGLKGTFSDYLSYYGEFIFEMGKSYRSGFTIQKNIRAFAGIFNLRYYIDLILNPVLIAQYGYGSGDTNRDDYRLPTGNTTGNDHGFIYFGTFVGGYALRPLLANMHIIRGGFAISPFSWLKMNTIRRMTIITKYSYYLKNKNMAAINYGADATRNKRHIGQGVDLSFRWRILSDLSLFVNYAIFIPGEAYGYSYNFLYGTSTYSSKSYKHFVMGGFNINF